MRTLTKTELLAVWENGANQSLIEKSLHLLSIACSVSNTSSIATLSIGERDGRLFKLREWMFGSRLVNIAHCPKCGETIEWETNIADLGLQDPQLEVAVKTFRLVIDGFNIHFRLPNSEDVIIATLEGAYRLNPNKLLADCILDVQFENNNFIVENLPEKIFEQVGLQMAQEDPQANISMLLSCPACGHNWESSFDIMGYLWSEIDNWAKHLLQEVYILARAFGWSEKDIIDMSVQRRQLYIEMLRS